MTEKSRESYFLSEIDKAIEIAAGKKIVSAEDFFKKDLNLSSIDLVDISFELEFALGKDIEFRRLMLSAKNTGSAKDDLQVRQLIDHLISLEQGK